MFVYEKKLQYPINIKTPNPKLAKIIISQYGGPDGELGASLLAKLNEEKANSALVADKSEIIESITEYVNSVAVGEEWNDIIYRNLVDKIYVHKDRTLDIHLKLIPEKWQAKILKGKAEIEQYSQNQNFLPQGGTSVPISVRVPFNSGRGIVKRWLR